MPILTDAAELNPTSSKAASSGPTPQWAQVFQAAMGAGLGGYAYVIALNGKVIDSGEYGNTRMPEDGAASWSTDSRCNLASVSKTVTATAIMCLIQQQLIMSVNDCFWPYLQPLLPKVVPATGVDTVTIGELLMMISRLKEDGTLYAKPDVLGFLADYLENNPIIPGQLYVYSNTNFTILQAVIESIAKGKGYQSYVDYVNQEVFKPMGVDKSVFSPVPDPENQATLAYVNALDPPYPPGKYWPQMNCVGPGGWIGSANAVAKYMIGLRTNVPLSAALTEFMQRRQFGWYCGGTPWGLCYHHNGGLHFQGPAGQPAGSICTGVVSFPFGYDAVLLANKPVDKIIALMIEAFSAGD
ncbi:MAG: serine hydrolase domain-containing protein [Bryobacteraceae bacterium]